MNRVDLLGLLSLGFIRWSLSPLHDGQLNDKGATSSNNKKIGHIDKAVLMN